jgi:hypothetical protein
MATDRPIGGMLLRTELGRNSLTWSIQRITRSLSPSSMPSLRSHNLYRVCNEASLSSSPTGGLSFTESHNTSRPSLRLRHSSLSNRHFSLTFAYASSDCGGSGIRCAGGGAIIGMLKGMVGGRQGAEKC